MEIYEIRELLEEINGGEDRRYYSDEVGYSSYFARAWYDGNAVIGETYFNWKKTSAEEARKIWEREASR